MYDETIFLSPHKKINIHFRNDHSTCIRVKVDQLYIVRDKVFHALDFHPIESWPTLGHLSQSCSHYVYPRQIETWKHIIATHKNKRLDEH